MDDDKTITDINIYIDHNSNDIITQKIAIWKASVQVKYLRLLATPSYGGGSLVILCQVI
jgi:hypothetical protein